MTDNKATRTRTVLSKQQKLEICQKVQNGASIIGLANEYRVVPNTIRRIRRDEKLLQHFVETQILEQSNQRKITHVENRLFAWVLERRVWGDLTSDILLREKALAISNKYGVSTFNASRDWLTKFKKRCNIHLSRIYGRRTSADEAAAEKFITKFHERLEKETIDYHNIYNMDEVGLTWTAVPPSTFMPSKEKNFAGTMSKKDYLAVGICANASGSHKLDISIYKFGDIKALKNCKSLPVIYRVHERTWMNKVIFSEWYENHFKPSVKKYQSENGRHGKVILILDCYEYIYGQSHNLELLGVQPDDNFEIIFLPPNTSTLLQPMNQGIITILQKTYLHKMLHNVLLHVDDTQQFYTKYNNVRECIRLLHEAWADINTISIQNAWKRILKTISTGTIEENPDSSLDTELSQIIGTITGEEPCPKRVAEFLSQCEEILNIYDDETEEGEGIQTKEGNGIIEEQQKDINISMKDKIEIYAHMQQQQKEINTPLMEQHEEASMEEKEEVNTPMQEQQERIFIPIEEPPEEIYMPEGEMYTYIEEQQEEINTFMMEQEDQQQQQQYENARNIKKRELEHALKIIEKYAKNKTTLVIAQSLIEHMLNEDT